MNFNTPKITAALTVALNLFALSAHAIETSPNNAIQENAEALKSVVAIGFVEEGGYVTCTSTLIAKNILLTARHCAVGIGKNDGIYIAGDQRFHVIDVSIPDTVENGNELTDVGLVLFTSEECSKSPLKNVEPLSFGQINDGHTYSNKVLLAGYGLSGPHKNDSGVLRAGYNQCVKSDYSVAEKNEIVSAIDADRLSQLFSRESLVFLGKRADKTVLVGSPQIENGMLQLLKNETTADSNAIGFSGDSGGPALAYDETGKATVVGVTSQVAPNVEAHDIELKVTAPNGSDSNFILTQRLLKKSKGDLVQAIVKTISANSSIKGLLTPNGKVTDMASFEIGNPNRVSAGIYSSVFSKFNREFIQTSLQKLQQRRDSMSGDICQ